MRKIVPYVALAVMGLAVAVSSCTSDRAPLASQPAPQQPAAAPAAVTPLYDIPRLDKIVVDGKSDDWGDGGFRVNILMPPATPPKHVKQHDARMRLAWDNDGLLVLLSVHADRWRESSEKGTFWLYDAVEVFVSPRQGTANVCQWVIVPGVDKEGAKLQWELYDHRTDAALKKLPAELQAARTKTADGYLMEVRVPWTAMGVKPEVGAELAAQLWVDYLGDRRRVGYYAAWFPGLSPHALPGNLHRIRLAQTASEPEWARTITGFDAQRMQYTVSVFAPAEKVGETVTIKDGRKTLLSGKLVADALGRASYTTLLPWAPKGSPYGTVEIIVGGKTIAAKQLPYSDQLDRIHALKQRQEELVRRYALDRPWDDLTGEPALIRKHRGLVASAIEALDIKPEADLPTSLQRLSEMAQAVEMLDQGKDYLATKRDQFWAAYYSPVDGAGCQFVVYLPRDYSPQRKYPMMVSLHGYSLRPYPGKDPWKEPYINVLPWGRGDTGYNALGDNDVLSVINYMKQWYSIDDDRVYLEGGSMGGSGTWTMACRHPDLFAAGAPQFGAAGNAPLENLRHVPFLNQHGAKDFLVVLSSSRAPVDRLQKLGYPIVHKEYPEAGHGIRDAIAPYLWMQQFSRVQRPKAITYTCQAASEGKAYWINVRQMADPHKLARVDAAVWGTGQRQTISLGLQNVEVLEFDLASAPLDRNSDLTVSAGCDFLTWPAPLPERLFVIRQKECYQLNKHWSPSHSQARAYQAGAAADLFTGEPLLVVYGTKAAEARSRILRDAAEKLSTASGSGTMAVGKLRVKADSAVTEEDLKHFNLILVGGATDNALTSRMMSKLPVKVNERNELLAGGRTPVSLEKAGLRLAYYNPLAPQRLIFLLASTAQDADLEKWLQNSQDLLTGSSGQNRIGAADLVVQGADGLQRRRMQFTHGWQWRTVPGGDVKPGQETALSRNVTTARLKVLHRLARADVALWWAPQDDQKEFDPQWFTLADAATDAGGETTLTCTLLGRDLIDMHKKWLGGKELIAWPSYEPKDIDAAREYRVIMPLWLSAKVTRDLQRNPGNVETGPELAPADVWKELFGPIK